MYELTGQPNTLQIQPVETIIFYITNPVNLANLAPYADHADHVDLYILKKPV